MVFENVAHNLKICTFIKYFVVFFFVPFFPWCLLKQTITIIPFSQFKFYCKLPTYFCRVMGHLNFLTYNFRRRCQTSLFFGFVSLTGWWVGAWLFTLTRNITYVQFSSVVKVLLSVNIVGFIEFIPCTVQMQICKCNTICWNLKKSTSSWHLVNSLDANIGNSKF